MTPSKFVMRLPLDSERSASFDFTSLKQKKVRCSGIQQIGRLVDHLDALPPLKVLEWGIGSVWAFVLHKNRPSDDKTGLLGLKICWDLVRAFLTEAELTVLPPDLLYSCDDGNHNVSGPYCHFGHFFIFNSFDETICWKDWLGLVPKRIVNQQFYSLWLFAASACVGTQMRTSVIAWTGEGGGF
jgi:hypothetical protein